MGRKQSHNPWSDEEVARFFEMRSEGKSRQQIADALGRTLGSIEGAVSNFGASPGEPRKVHSLSLIVQMARIHGPAKAARLLKMSRTSIYRRLREDPTYEMPTARAQHFKKSHASRS